MKEYRLALYEKDMPDGLTWAEKLRAGREAGFDALELSIDESDRRLSRLEWSGAQRRELLQLSRENGMYINTICLSGHRRCPLGSADSQVRQQGMQVMRQALELAYDLGVRIIQLAGYDVTYGEPSTPSTRERFLENLAQSVQMASACGVVLALETMENSFMNTVEKAMYYVDTIHSPYLQVYPDVGNITNAVEDLGRDLRAGRGSIVAAHLKETAPNVYRNLKFGQGRVDFALAARLLRSMGVSLFTAEFWYDGSDGWEEELKRANRYLRGFLDRAG